MTIHKEHYGADADGNRGIDIEEAELDNEDLDVIKEEFLYSNVEGYDLDSESFDIDDLSSDFSFEYNGYTFDENIYTWFSEEEIKKFVIEFLKDAGF